MYEFDVLEDGLLSHLSLSHCGANINIICGGSLADADDISLATIYKYSLQKQLDMDCEYSCIWRFRFNTSKSAVVVSGTDEDPTRVLHLGPDQIQVVTCAHHMGVALTTTKLAEGEFIRDRVSSSETHAPVEREPSMQFKA